MPPQWNTRMRSTACWSQAGTPPTQLVVEEEDLEQYFLRLVGMRRMDRRDWRQDE